MPSHCTISDGNRSIQYAQNSSKIFNVTINTFTLLYNKVNILIELRRVLIIWIYSVLSKSIGLYSYLNDTHCNYVISNKKIYKWNSPISNLCMGIK